MLLVRGYLAVRDIGLNMSTAGLMYEIRSKLLDISGILQQMLACHSELVTIWQGAHLSVYSVTPVKRSLRRGGEGSS